MTETIHLTESEPLDLDATLGCGQAFRWRRQSGGRWEGIVGASALRLCQDGHRLQYSGADEDFVRHYLALDHDLEAILSAIDRDEVVRAAIETSYGLRVLRQPLFECLVSYLCATNTNIPTVERRIHNLSTRFGMPIRNEGVVSKDIAFAFPSATALTTATMNDLRACRLGYRARYAESIARTLCALPAWEALLRGLSHESARAALMELPGIGPKAADCIVLFGLGHLDAFPVDLWIRRILARRYGVGKAERPLTAAEYARVRGFGREHFGGFAGYAQEYLYSARHLICRG